MEPSSGSSDLLFTGKKCYMFRSVPVEAWSSELLFSGLLGAKRGLNTTSSASITLSSQTPC